MTTYIHLNFRGHIKPIHRTHFRKIGYLKCLLEGPMKEDAPKDENGYIMIDESSTHFFYLIDLYTTWVGAGEPDYFDDKFISCRMLYAGIAERLLFDEDFVKAIRNKNKHDPTKDELFKCYYCTQIFSTTENAKNRECTYHIPNCGCHLRRGCRRLPYHSPVEIKMAVPPKK